MDLNGTYEKRPLRAAARAYRDQLDAAYRTDADRAIASRIVASAAFAEAPAVMAYYAVGTEVDTRAIISTALEAGKTVALPRCRRGGLMDWHRIAALTDVAPGYGGIPGPADDPSTLIDAAALPRPPWPSCPDCSSTMRVSVSATEAASTTASSPRSPAAP